MHLDDSTIALLASGLCPPEREAALRGHLAQCASCASRLEALRPQARERATGQLPSAEEEEKATVVVGTPTQLPLSEGLQRHARLGRYVVLDDLGEGGMGVVYAAYDPELDRKVALKLLRASPVGSRGHSEGHARLLREAQAMARISHPHVVAVHDVGTWEDRVFMAMEYVEGTTLRRWLKEAPRPWREVLEAFLAAGRGLAAAHAAGLVHRDFKPDNILVHRDGRVLVTDFGLARLAGSTPEPETALYASSPERENTGPRLHEPLTQQGQVVGTPHYMAPEQHQGRPPDARSDQFSFCAALYYALYEQRPFSPAKLAAAAKASEDSAATEPLGGAYPHANVILEPPARPRLPRWLKRAMLRGLALSPAQRFGSMEELLAHLSGPPPSVRRARWAAGVALGVGLVSLATGALVRRQDALCSGASQQLAGVWDSGVKQRVRTAFLATGKPYAATTWSAVQAAVDDYGQGWVAQHTEACKATRVRGEQAEHVLALRMACLERRRRTLKALSTLWAEADGPAVERAATAAGALPPLASCEDVESLTLRVPPPTTPQAQAELQRIGALLSESQAQEGAGRLPRARELIQQAVDGARQLGYAPLLAEALLRAGTMANLMQEPKRATEAAFEAFRVAEVGRDDEARAYAAAALVGSVGYMEGRVEEGLRWAEVTRAVLERLGGRERIEMSLAMSLTAVNARAGRAADARQAAERAVALSEKLLSPDNLWRARHLGNLAGTYLMAGEHAQARARLEQAVAQVERIAGPGHPDAARLLGNLSEVALAQEDLEAALDYGRRGLELTEATLGADSPRAGMVRHTLAALLARKGQHAQAVEDFQRAQAIIEKALGPTHPNLAHPLLGRARCYLELRRPEQALPLLERALGLQSEPETQADTRFVLAQALVALGRDASRARALAQQAQEAYEAAGKKASAEQVRAWRQQQPGPARP